MNYSKFTSLTEFLQDENISKMLSESKCGSPKKEEEEEIANKANKTDEEEHKEDSVNSDKLEVNYAEDIKEYKNIFKHIIIFTNDKDPKSNKTLKNIYEAVKNLKSDKCPIIPELHVFEAAEMVVDDNELEVNISDGDEKLVLKNESNVDTLVFARLSVQGEDQCEHIVELLQDRGFLVLNPVKYSALACDKYESAVLFKKGEIPQPNFTLMTKDILYDEKLYNSAMKEVYPEWSEKDPDKNEKLMFVVKILDGHGGTGVAMIDGKKILAIFQMIFAIDPERRLILQKKEEADGGDIRVHVLTLRDKQVILAKMKRVKLGGDFRSNISLGAEAEPIELTPEQEQIALKTAKLSKLPWCAVDIMPLVKGSNPEIGDNVVLEINASPGTAGISEVMEENFINILLNNLTDTNQFMLQDKVAGYIESVNVKFDDNISKDFLAKLDTGNSTTASCLEVGEFEEKNNKVTFNIDGKNLTYDVIDHSNALAGDIANKRPVIEVPLVTLGLRKVEKVRISIVKSREKKTTNLLLNRDVLSRLGYVVHPNKTHVLTKEMEKVKII